MNQPMTALQPTGDYSRLVRAGHYGDMPTGMWGKYDNVRRYWENQITRFSIGPALQRMLVRTRNQARGLRILDMGCGSGEGWDLLVQVPSDQTMGESSHRLIGPDDVAYYHGVDLCPDMVEQARQRFQGSPCAQFDRCDLSEPERILETNDSYDMYYSSYGSLSHLPDDQLARLLSALGRHAKHPCTIVLDLLGQYSAEWPCYWGYSRRESSPRMVPYTMTWIYPPDEQPVHKDEFSDYRLRLWGGRELEKYLYGIPEIKRRLARLSLVDRSIMIGRHVDTGEFNSGAKPIRRALNGLFEFNHRTQTDDLKLRPLPESDDAEVNDFYRSYNKVWNATVDVFHVLFEGGDVRKQLAALNEIFETPLTVGIGCEALINHYEAMSWLQPGDPLSNALQPQIALLLRQFEFHMQRGLGCGHGLVAVLELE